MKRILLAAAISLVASASHAQVQSEMAELKKLNVAIGLPTNAKNTATDGTAVTLTSILKQISASVQAAATAANQALIIGSKTGGTAAASSLLTGGVSNTTLPTLTDGQQASLQMTTRGSVVAQLYNGAVAITGSADNADAVAETASANAMKVATRPFLYNGTTWDRQRGNTFGAFEIIRDAAGNARGVNVNAANELTVSAAITSSALPTGAATAVKQPALGTAGTPSADVVTVQGAASGTPVPVSAATLPLPAGASTSAIQASVIGTKAAGTAATNSLLIGGINTTTQPTLTDGQQYALQMTTRGAVIAALYNGTVQINGLADNADAIAEGAGANALKVVTRPYLYNGTTWDRARGNTFGAFGVIRDAAGNARGVNVNASNELLVAATISGLPASLGSKADLASLAVTQSTEDKAQLQLVLDRLTAIETLITTQEPAALGNGGGKLTELVDSAGNPVKFNSPAAGDLLTPYSATTTSGECFAEDLTGRERILRNTGTARVGVGFAPETVTILTATYVMDPGGSVTTGKDGYVGSMRCVAESGTQAVAKTILN